MKPLLYLNSILITLCLAGCASVHVHEEWDQLTQCSNSQDDLIWVQDAQDEELVCNLIQDELQNPFNIQSALKIALINNKAIQADFENIGISKSDLVQAGLFKNPSLSALFRFPLPGAGTMFEGDFLTPISQLWQMPIRKQMAQNSLEKTLLHVADNILQLKKNVKQAYNHAVFHAYIAKLSYKYLSVSNDLLSEAKQRAQWGYIIDDELFQTEISYNETLLFHEEAKLMQITSKEHLAQLLSLSSNQFTLQHLLLDITLPNVDIEHAFSSACSNRLDLRSAEFKVSEHLKLIHLNKARIFKDAHAGISFERDLDGKKLLGPVFDIELPIFDQNQAQIAKASFMLRQSQKELDSLTDKIRMEISNDSAHINFLKKKASILKNQIIPLQQKISSFRLNWNELMQINKFQFINAKKDLIEQDIEFTRTLMELNHHIYNLEYHSGESISSLTSPVN